MTSAEDFRTYLPKFLSEESTKKLLAHLEQFEEDEEGRSADLFTATDGQIQGVLQGDCIDSMPYWDPYSKQISDVPSVILSNSCDVDPSNKRLFKAFCVFAPIFNLERYAKSLKEELPADRWRAIENHIGDIKKQRVTQIFFLPTSANIPHESFIRFDVCASMPVDLLDNSRMLKDRLFVLSNYGIYLFLFKLSVHYCRIQDGVDRG